MTRGATTKFRIIALINSELRAFVNVRVDLMKHIFHLYSTALLSGVYTCVPTRLYAKAIIRRGALKESSSKYCRLQRTSVLVDWPGRPRVRSVD